MRYELRRDNLLLTILFVLAGFIIAFLVRGLWRNLDLPLGMVVAISVVLVTLIYEIVYRLSHYLILHEGYLDISEASWGIPLGRTKQTIDYSSIASVDSDDALRTVKIVYHPLHSPGRYAGYTNSIMFNPRDIEAVATEIRQRVRAVSAEGV